ncbi:MAG: hypothetical protein MJ130_06805 [Lachnospiraceae bacterium]|nr:hypothetical protein [Lachnospiraceae bacterium]
MRGIDDYDYELAQKKERYSFRFTVNFKKMYMMNNTLREDNGERDEEYPKNIFVTMLLGIWLAMTVLFCFSKNFLWIVTLPFMVFYIIALVGVFKNWKEYKYKMWQIVLMTIGGFLISATIGVLFQMFVLKL